MTPLAAPAEDVRRPLGGAAPDQEEQPASVLGGEPDRFESWSRPARAPATEGALIPAPESAAPMPAPESREPSRTPPLPSSAPDLESPAGVSAAQAAYGNGAVARAVTPPAAHAARDGAEPPARSASGAAAAGAPSVKVTPAETAAPRRAATAAAPAHRGVARLAASSNADELFESLAAVPPSALPSAIAGVKGRAAQLHQEEKAAIAQSLPTATPPSFDALARTAPAPIVVEPGRADTAVAAPAAGAPSRTPPPSVHHDVATGPLPATLGAVPTPVDQASFEALVASMPAEDAALSTSAGPRPQLDLTGDADPALGAQHQLAADASITAKRLEWDRAAAGGGVERLLVPRPAAHHPRPPFRHTPAPAAAGGESAQMPAMTEDVRAVVDAQTAPWIGAQVQQQVDSQRQRRTEYEAEASRARADGERQIDEQGEAARANYTKAHDAARADIGGRRQALQAENAGICARFDADAGEQRRTTERQIEEKARATDRQVDQELTSAEQRADAERLNAEARAAEEKRKAENKPKSWWESVKGAITSVYDAIKSVVNAIFDALRWAVKKIIEGAKLLVRGLIELARLYVTGLLKAFALVLKGLVTVALLAFPEAAARARAWIDARTDEAIEAVTAVAETFKNVTDAILDAVGTIIDTALHYVQVAYNIAIDVMRMLATGAFLEIYGKLKNLSLAAWEGGGQLEGAIWKELLGFDVTKDLGPQLMADESAGNVDADAHADRAGDPENIAFLLQDSIRDDQVLVDPTPQFEIDDQLAASVALGDGDAMCLGELSDPQRSGAAIVGSLLQSLPQESLPSADDKGEEAAVDQDPAMKAVMERLMAAKDRSERLDAVKDLVLAGIKQFWEKKLKPNLWWIIPALLLALAAFVALEVVTGGAITAALPIVLEAVTVLFFAYDAARVVGGLTEYLEKGWAGDIAAAASGFARGIATGVVAVLMFFLMEAGGKALKLAFKGLARLGRGVAKVAKIAGEAALDVGKAGLKLARSAVKGLVKGVLYIGKLAVKAWRIVARMAPATSEFVLEKGKLIFRGLERGFLKAAKGGKELFLKLKEFFGRFKGFTLERHGQWFYIYAILNPRRILVGIFRAKPLAAGPEEAERLIAAIAKQSGKAPGEVEGFLRMAAQMGDEGASLAKRMADELAEGGQLSKKTLREFEAMTKRLEAGATEAGNRANRSFRDPITGKPLDAGGEAHMRQRWFEYQQRNRARYPEIDPELDPVWQRQYERVLENGEVGRGFEGDALGKYGYKKNNLVFLEDTPGGDGFIPDSIKSNPAEVEWGKPYDFVEVKGWQNMSNTGNLGAMIDYVEKFGGSIEAIFREDTHISKPLMDRLRALRAVGKARIRIFKP